MGGCCSDQTCTSANALPVSEQERDGRQPDYSNTELLTGHGDILSNCIGPSHEENVVEPGKHGCCESAFYRDTPTMTDSTRQQYLKDPDVLGSATFNTFPSPQVRSCSDGDDICCVRKLSRPAENTSPGLQTDPKLNNFTSTIVELDATEIIMMEVQGMTCVGCEKNLIKALSAITGVSKIKTSLLLCRAEFDFRKTEKLQNCDMVMKEVERMTGFECTRLVRRGEELELILSAHQSQTAHTPPPGVSLEYRGRDKLLISFNPSSIGARDLLSHPFFNNAKIAPLRPSPSASSGRAGLCNSSFMTAVSIVLTVPVLVLAYGEFPDRQVLYGAISLALATVIQVVVAGPFYIRAIKTLLFSQMIEMDMLVVLSTSIAYVYSVIAYAFMVCGSPLSTSSFFETSTLLVTVIMVGQTLGKLARQQAVESVSFESLQTQTAVIVDLKSRVEQQIDARLLQYGDVFKVLPDDSVVTDGTIIEGETEVDESMITGESNLVRKIPGNSIVAGSINHSGVVFVHLTKLPSENTIKTINSLVDEAKSSRPKAQEIADVFAGYFTPIIVLMTIVVFVIWVAIGKAIRLQSTSTACINAMTFAIATLVVSCPCAVGLAVPMVVVIACGVGAHHGLILKRSQTVEIARKISHVVFDKTGTLTEGNLSVVLEEYHNTSEAGAAVALGLVMSSKHPVSMAIAKHLGIKGIMAAHLVDVTSIPGCGIEGAWNGVQVRAGNQFWLGVESSQEVQTMTTRGLTIVCVTVNNKLVAIYGLEDHLRTEAQEVVGELKKRGVTLSLISGDNAEAVNSIASQLSIPPSYVRSRCSPSDKAAYIQSLLFIPDTTVLFVGDGTNDAVALTAASIGMHMNSGTDIAQSAADTILMHSSLRGVLTLIDLSRAFHRRVVFNFAWSFFYNLFAILLAAGAFEGTNGKVRIEPRYAGLGELVSILPVIAVAVSLRWVKL